MKNIFVLSTALVMSLGVNIQTKVKLVNGKSIPVRITTKISTNEPNNSVQAIVDADVKCDSGDYTVIRRGTPVEVSAEIVKQRGCVVAGSNPVIPTERKH